MPKASTVAAPPKREGSRVHDLDSFGAIPLESKVQRFAIGARWTRWRGVTASRGKWGHAGHDPEQRVFRPTVVRPVHVGHGCFHGAFHGVDGDACAGRPAAEARAARI